MAVWMCLAKCVCDAVFRLICLSESKCVAMAGRGQGGVDEQRAIEGRTARESIMKTGSLLEEDDDRMREKR
jgi:hypothetical protein